MKLNAFINRTAIGLAMCLGFSATSFAGETVNIYSYRQPELIQPLLDAFTKETGIETQVQFLNKGMAERLEAEGANSPADVILTTDIGRLVGLEDKGLTRSITNATISENIPHQYRDSEGNWFGLTVRARVVFASRERVSQDTITYEELADPKWRGKICTRSGQHAYNIALFASMVAHKGEEFTTKWLEGVKANLHHRPDGNDRAQARAIYSGECDLGIGNTYYVGLMETNEKKPEQKEWRNAIKVLFPNAEDRGTHVNVSGMAMARHAPNAENALKLMKFLSSAEAQKIYAEQVFEYPVTPGVEASDIVKNMGELKADTISLETVAEHRKDASVLVDKVGYDDGPQS